MGRLENKVCLITGSGGSMGRAAALGFAREGADAMSTDDCEHLLDFAWSAEERAEWMALFENSGQTALEFCRDNHRSPTTLAFWRSQRKDAAIRPDLDEAAFVEVPLAALNSGAAPACAAAVTIHWPSACNWKSSPTRIPPGSRNCSRRSNFNELFEARCV